VTGLKEILGMIASCLWMAQTIELLYLTRKATGPTSSRRVVFDTKSQFASKRVKWFGGMVLIYLEILTTIRFSRMPLLLSWNLVRGQRRTGAAVTQHLFIQEYLMGRRTLLIVR
jgi:hypothetical protein